MLNKARLDRVIANMRAYGLEQIIVSSTPSVYYLTGVWLNPGERMYALYINTDGETALYVNRLFAMEPQGGLKVVEFDDTEDPVAILAKQVRPGSIGIDKMWPSHFTIRLMQAAGVTPVLGSGPMDDARMCKDAEEIALMRESSLMNDKAIGLVMERLHEGMTELELDALYRACAKEVGAEGMSFDPITCFGPNCAEPHHANDETVLKRGDSIILDVGLMHERYCSDMTRTIFFGEPTEEQRKVYELVHAANEAGRAAVRPGLPMKEFDRAARSVIEAAGYGEYFIHRTGHGIGMEVHEFPDNSSVCEIIARPGMCFSVEPGIYLPGKFGVRIEDLVCVTEDGCETLNHFSRELRVL